MPTYKNIKIKKKGGGTRLQRVQVLKSGKYKFVKNLNKKVKKTKKKSKKSTKRSVKRKMPRKKKRNRGGKNIQATMFKLIRMGALVGPAAITVLTPGRDAPTKGKDLLWQFTG